MNSSRSHQPRRPSSNLADYDRLFLPRVHRLIILGYGCLNPKQHATDEEPAITGDLIEAIDTVLDERSTKWMPFYFVGDDPPVNEPQRRGRPRRRGKHRRRLDICFVSSELSPRTRFRFECKRLGKRYPVTGYLGREGLGRFLRAEYAREDVRAGMLGYVQSDDEETWAGKLHQKLADSPQDYAVRRDSPWRHEPVTAECPHTYRSGHGRGSGRKPIEIYHTLLRFC